MFVAFALLPMVLAAEAAVFPPNENLVADGVPAVPAGLPGRVGAYTEFRTAPFVAWHPQRREMLVATRFADTVQLHRVEQPGGARRQLTFFPDRVTAAAYPRTAGPGEPSFVFSKDSGGNEFHQLYRFDPRTGAVTLLTDGKSRNSLGVWARDGKRLAYTSTRRNGADTDLYVIEPADPKTDRMVAQVSGGGWSVLDFSPDGKTLLVEQGISIGVSHLWRFDVSTGARTRLTPEDNASAYRGGRFAPDGKSIFVASDRGGEFLRLVRIAAETGATELASYSADIPWDVEEFDVSPDGRTLAAVVNEHGVGVLRVFDARTRKEWPRLALPPGSVSDPVFHANGRDLAFSLVSASAPTEAYSMDLRTRKVVRWTFSETGGLDLRGMPEPERVSWTSFDGLSLSGFLYHPPARFTGKRPVIVNIHGGPESQARPGFQGRNNFLLNELGVAILYPNVRGSTGYGKTFTNLDNGTKREDSVKDIGALLDWIRTRSDLDADRILVLGGSYGGYMSLAVSVAYADRIRCSVDVVGISNFVTFLERTEAYRRDLRRVEYGDERDPEMRAFLQRIAPVNHADKIKKPIFIVQGKNDPRVPHSESEQMVATLRKQGTAVSFLWAKDEGHGFAKKKNADYLFYALVGFIEQHLLGNGK